MLLNSLLKATKIDDGVQRVYEKALKDLRAGKLREGWLGYEARLRLFSLVPEFITSSWPVWDGKKKGKVLVWTEQGLGDALFFSRWLKRAREVAGEIHVLDRMCMLRMWDECKCVDKVIDRGFSQPLSGYDYQVSLLSLPHVLNSPIVDADLAFDGLVDRLPSLMRNASIKKVGVCWAGNPDNPTNHKRNADLKDMTPLLMRNDVACVSLQMSTWYPYKERPAEQGLLRRLVRITESLIDDVYDVACLVKQLDAVVTVDTMIAHLAGLLNIPVYVMLDDDCDWRWGYETGKGGDKGERTRWYDSMRLFRRGEGECWKRVVEEINGIV